MSYGLPRLARALPALAALTFAAFTAPASAALGAMKNPFTRTPPNSEAR